MTTDDRCTCPRSDTLAPHLHGCPVPEAYNGWTNRETWAVALHINNDQGWQESVLGSLVEYRDSLCWDCTEAEDGHEATEEPSAWQAGEIIRESVEDTLETLWEFHSNNLRDLLADIGSLWRVNWTELGAAFLADLAELDR